LTGRVKEGRKGLPLPATGDEKGAFFVPLSKPYAKTVNFSVNLQNNYGFIYSREHLTYF
jgi:hypothetical protein